MTIIRANVDQRPRRVKRANLLEGGIIIRPFFVFMGANMEAKASYYLTYTLSLLPFFQLLVPYCFTMYGRGRVRFYY